MTEDSLINRQADALETMSLSDSRDLRERIRKEPLTAIASLKDPIVKDGNPYQQISLDPSGLRKVLSAWEGVEGIYQWLLLTENIMTPVSNIVSLQIQDTKQDNTEEDNNG